MSDDVSLETDEDFKRLGPQGEKALDLIVGLLPCFGKGAPDLLRRRMLFYYLVVYLLEHPGPLWNVLMSSNQESAPLKALYFTSLYDRAAKQGVDDIDQLCELVDEDSDRFHTFLYR